MTIPFLFIATIFLCNYISKPSEYFNFSDTHCQRFDTIQNQVSNTTPLGSLKQIIGWHLSGVVVLLY